ncbi:MAG: radical SAM protein [Candidatus Omnitrophota bacterium]
MSLSAKNACHIVLSGLKNCAGKRPLVLSFELTDSCNANCLHCDKGGIVHEENRLSPYAYANIWRKFRSPVVQLSGGEPLLRNDIVDIAGAIKEPSGLPYLILVTNGYLLNRDNYLELRNKGVNQFSVSLDFPDERHDAFRRLKGLFSHLNETIPQLTGLGHNDIALNCCITRENFKYIPDILQKAKDWNAAVSFSAYSLLRTNDKNYSITEEADLKLLYSHIRKLTNLRKENPGAIRTPRRVLLETYKFFKEGSMSKCHAGERFLLVSPDGRFRPCAHHARYYNTHKGLVDVFSKRNKCGSCYVSIRAFADIPLKRLLWDYLVGALRGEWKL